MKMDFKKEELSDIYGSEIDQTATDFVNTHFLKSEAELKSFFKKQMTKEISDYDKYRIWRSTRLTYQLQFKIKKIFEREKELLEFFENDSEENFDLFDKEKNLVVNMIKNFTNYLTEILDYKTKYRFFGIYLENLFKEDKTDEEKEEEMGKFASILGINPRDTSKKVDKTEEKIAKNKK